MIKLAGAVLGLALIGSSLSAQAPAGPARACPARTAYSAIRHNMIKPGQWSAFEGAVAAHNAWYVAHGNNTQTVLVRVIGRGNGAALNANEAVTITRYADTPQPEHDGGWSAFTAKYRASSDLKDEARVCLPPMH